MKPQNMKNAVTVYCTDCGFEMLRKPVKHSKPWPAYAWFTTTGEQAHHCPDCGVATSSETTSPDVRSRAQMLQQLDQKPPRMRGFLWRLIKAQIDASGDEAAMETLGRED